MRVLSLWLLAFSLLGAAETRDGEHVSYVVNTSRRGEHILHVSITFPPGHRQSAVQLPTWYALYQIRDFSQYVLNVRAYSANNKLLPTRSVDKTTWAVQGAVPAERFEYDTRCNLAGPYGLEIGSDHLFINPAILLMCLPENPTWPSTVRFEGLPAGWNIETPLREENLSFFANNYEDLADSPFWIGKFNEAEFTTAGAEVRVVVDFPAHTADMSELIRRDRRIVSAEADWMGGLPVKDYLFLYQFSSKTEIEGMEHSRATAIRVPLSAVKESITAIDSVTAHEFFHLWNVMRIRPCSMEPVDYTHEQYSRALWFSEGVTSTVARYVLLRAGLLTEQEYLQRLGNSISDLEDTPARTWQSAEDASVTAWLSGYAPYQASDRSVNYYGKGELLGVLLDLMIRTNTNGQRSLQDLFQLLEAQYGKQHHCFSDSDGIQMAVEAVTRSSASEFFKNYVAGTAAIPYNEYFSFVGLQLVRQNGTLRFADVPDITPTQRLHRSEWLNTSFQKHQGTPKLGSGRFHLILLRSHTARPASVAGLDGLENFRPCLKPLHRG